MVYRRKIKGRQVVERKDAIPMPTPSETKVAPKDERTSAKARRGRTTKNEESEMTEAE